MLRVFTSRDETKAFYDKISKVYDLLAERSEEPMRQAGLEMLAAAPGESILEIGFGTGHCLVALADAVGPQGKVFGIDISEGMLAEATATLARLSLNDRVELRTGDATCLPYPPAAMDGVFMSFTLELFDTPEIPAVLRECLRVLKPTGRLVVVAMSKEDEDGFVVHAYEWSHRHFPNFVDCRPILVRGAIESAGLHVRQAKKARMWLPVEIVLASTSI